MLRSVLHVAPPVQLNEVDRITCELYTVLGTQLLGAVHDNRVGYHLYTFAGAESWDNLTQSVQTNLLSSRM